MESLVSHHLRGYVIFLITAVSMEGLGLLYGIKDVGACHSSQRE